MINCIGIFWTNTVPNMPPWGGRDARLGNNPITLAIPHGDTPVLVDVAMSMFSYGKLEVYKRSGRPLPVDGGLNKNQQPTRNAAEIDRGLPRKAPRVHALRPVRLRLWPPGRGQPRP